MSHGLFKYSPEIHLAPAGPPWYLDSGGYGLGRGRRAHATLDVALLFGNAAPMSIGQPADLSARGSRRKAGDAGHCRMPPTAGAPAGHQHRMGNRAGHPGPTRHQASLLGQLLSVTRAVPEPPSIRQCIPGPGDRAPTPRRGAAMRKWGRRGAPQASSWRYAVPADCRLRGGALSATARPTTPSSPTRVNLRTGESWCASPASGRQGLPGSPSSDATVRVQFTADARSPSRGTRAVIHYDNLFR